MALLTNDDLFSQYFKTELQDQMSYLTWPIIVGGIFLFLCLMCMIIIMLMKRPKKVAPAPVVAAPVKTLQDIKVQYYSELQQIDVLISSGKIDLKSAYQQMSTTLRHFIYEATGVKVQNLSLLEIKMLNMPVIANLVEEYYAPEFAEKSVGNFRESIEKTKWVVSQWN